MPRIRQSDTLGSSSRRACKVSAVTVGPRGRELASVRFQSGDVRERGLEQTHAYFGARLRRVAEPRAGRGHQAHRVETQGGAQLQGEPEVTAVHRIERSAQNPDRFDGWGLARWHDVSQPPEKAAQEDRGSDARGCPVA